LIDNYIDQLVLPPNQALLLLLLLLASGFIPLAHFLGASHLLGAFLAGLCCCTEPRLHAAWTKQVIFI